MFQTTYERPRKSIRVSLVLAGKPAIEGYMLVLQDETILKVLNGADQFILFETDLCERLFIAKGAIQSVSEVEALKAAGPKTEEVRLVGRFASTDPQVVLGIDAGASPEELRQAYHALVREFHSDRLVSLGLHKELTVYADEVLKRVNMAYSSLQAVFRPAA